MDMRREITDILIIIVLALGIVFGLSSMANASTDLECDTNPDTSWCSGPSEPEECGPGERSARGHCVNEQLEWDPALDEWCAINAPDSFYCGSNEGEWGDCPTDGSPCDYDLPLCPPGFEETGDDLYPCNDLGAGPDEGTDEWCRVNHPNDDTCGLVTIVDPEDAFRDAQDGSDDAARVDVPTKPATAVTTQHSASQDTLPATGVSAVGWVLAGLMLVGLGGLVVMATRDHREFKNSINMKGR